MLEGIEKRRIAISKKFAFFALSFLVGVLIGPVVPLHFANIWPLLPLVFAIILFALFVNFLLKNHLFVFVGFNLIFLAIGLFFFLGFKSKTYYDWPYGSGMTMVGEVVTRPERSNNQQKIVLRVESIKYEGENQKLKNKLLIANVTRLIDLEYGDKVKIEGKISKSQESKDFDYQRYLKKYPAYGSVNNPEKIEKIESKKSLGKRTLSFLYNFSSKLESSLNQTLPEPHSSLAAGIILGQKRSLPEDFSNNLKRVGLTHIVAISGFNVTVIFVVLEAILSSYLPPKKVFWGGFTLAIILVLMTGMASSIVRAAIFSLLVLLGRTIGRRASQTNLLLLAALVMLLINPFLLSYDLGFELSFLAFLGLIYVSPLIRKRFEAVNNDLLQTWVLVPLAETLGAQIAVTPLILTMFGQLSLIAPLSNLLVIWAVELVMAFAFLTAFLGLASIWLAKYSAYLLWPLLEYIVKVVETLGRMRFASIEIENNSYLVMFLMYAGLISVLKKYWFKYRL